MGSSRRGTRTLESCSPQPQLLCGNSERDRRQRQEKRQRKTEFEKWKVPCGPRLQVGIPPPGLSIIPLLHDVIHPAPKMSAAP